MQARTQIAPEALIKNEGPSFSESRGMQSGPYCKKGENKQILQAKLPAAKGREDNFLNRALCTVTSSHIILIIAVTVSARSAGP
ncbi:hypothetical protein BDQ94DRAFT_142925 [Aspergillus welwitschiae]|uniref:Uncharacterized protein n=1 Tax=Aspergillus welwitschiae TaxID=1341132 RepID=A0A3F3Q423_9EURO|nr:uncharacterized protein BO96DRAFT_219901 [Aspergillus niger CBS 101883]XP_026626952.1 hypothetical protein BDQ94DRAFT_142925 [Aspergillus welwitschiae]PYH50740.1 hypothetical protein BO96DRAFT_219901 [Aspergillus niger CBS 101883]RDH33930.1 hypothetical protein BDQ94DRAFT_142925 [Aspergillus welwitschiae]